MKVINNNRSGYTLVELLIYLVVSTIVILIAMNLIKMITKSYVHEKGVSEAQSEARDVASVISRDIVNVGFKTMLVRTGTTDALLTVPRTTGWADAATASIDLDKTSSFYWGSSTNYDTLCFKRIVATDNNQLAGVDSIVYYVDEATMELKRKRFTVTPAEVTANNTTMGAAESDEVLASGVEAFKLQFNLKNTVDWTTTINDQRSNVGAIRFSVLIRTPRETSIQGPTSFNMGDATAPIPVTVPADKRQRRQYSETVQVVNNGL